MRSPVHIGPEAVKDGLVGGRLVGGWVSEWALGGGGLQSNHINGSYFILILILLMRIRMMTLMMMMNMMMIVALG